MLFSQRAPAVPNLATSRMRVVIEYPYQRCSSTWMDRASSSVSRAIFATTDLFANRRKNRSLEPSVRSNLEAITPGRYISA
jgi:hypothetical protein